MEVKPFQGPHNYVGTQEADFRYPPLFRHNEKKYEKIKYKSFLIFPVAYAYGGHYLNSQCSVADQP